MKCTLTASVLDDNSAVGNAVLGEEQLLQHRAVVRMQHTVCHAHHKDLFWTEQCEMAQEREMLCSMLVYWALQVSGNGPCGTLINQFATHNHKHSHKGKDKEQGQAEPQAHPRVEVAPSSVFSADCHTNCNKSHVINRTKLILHLKNPSSLWEKANPGFL